MVKYVTKYTHVAHAPSPISLWMEEMIANCSVNKLLTNNFLFFTYAADGGYYKWSKSDLGQGIYHSSCVAEKDTLKT